MNKYCIIYTVKYNNTDSLLNYRGILYTLGLKNKNFDTYINCDIESFNIIQKIIQQEKWTNNLENVHFQILNKLTNTIIPSLKTFVDNYEKYTIFGFYNTTFELGANYFDFIQKYNYGIVSRVNYFNENIFPYNDICYINPDVFFICKNYLKTDIEKIKNIIYQLYDTNIDVYTSNLYCFLYCLDFYYNNCLYFNDISNKNIECYKDINYSIYTNVQWYWHYYDLKKSSFYNNENNTYLIDKNIYYIEKVYNINNHRLRFYDGLLKNMFLYIQRYMLDYIKNIDLSIYNKSLKVNL